VNMHMKWFSSEASFVFQPKMQQISFTGRAALGPAEDAYSAPQDPYMD